MANILKVGMKESIFILDKQGCSRRHIARTLGINRRTVGKYLGGEVSKCTISTPGSGRRSSCERHAVQIAEKLHVGLSAQRIYQDIVSDFGFSGSYQSVKRYVRKLGSCAEEPFRRMECAPGEEAQVDFGSGGRIIREDGSKSRPHVFRITLSFSRKSYSEAVLRQDTETFIRVLENSFRYFGGVPRTIVPDNLKAAVIKADWYDPDVNPKVKDFCSHYGTVILPTRPATPRHKGKVERAIGYVQGNALRGRTFRSLAEENAFLSEWEGNVADTRIHGTTKKQIRSEFEKEKPHLLPLPPDLFPCFEEGIRTVHRDGHVEVSRAYYSVPAEYTGRQVRVRWDLRSIRVFNMRGEQIHFHARREAGNFCTEPAHISRKRISGVEKGEQWMLNRASLIGTFSRQWAEAMLKNRGIEGIRVLQGFLCMSHKHKAEELENCCRQAAELGAYRLRELRGIMKSSVCQPEIPFLDEHPVIRNLDFYGKIVSEKETSEKGVFQNERESCEDAEKIAPVGNVADAGCEIAGGFEQSSGLCRLSGTGSPG
jgi:transposase